MKQTIIVSMVSQLRRSEMSVYFFTQNEQKKGIGYMKKIKRYMAGLLAVALMVSMFSYVTVYAADAKTTALFPDSTEDEVLQAAESGLGVPYVWGGTTKDGWDCSGYVTWVARKLGVDRIFTRVGASDDLASGQSTFMVEMTEVANILRNATSNSLLVLDEIGRGTSTFDGLSIAWAVVEHISNPKLLGAKTLFATHYHELTELEGKLNNVNNYCIAVKEKGDDVVFLRKIVPGGADKSYGIQVAKLAGVPESVIERAKAISEELSAHDIAELTGSLISENTRPKKKQEKLDEVDLTQMSLFDTVKDDDIIGEIRELDLGNLTPIDALNKLYHLQSKVKNRWKFT